jgi:hypothetical protein
MESGNSGEFLSNVGEVQRLLNALAGALCTAAKAAAMTIGESFMSV